MTARRLLFALVALLSLQAASAAGLQGSLPPASPEATLFERALKEGGTTAVCLVLAAVLVWVLQRDDKRQQRATDREDKLTSALVAFAAAAERQANAIAQNTTATEANTEVVAGCPNNRHRRS